MQIARDRVMQEVRKHFRPELLNRLDEIVVFDRLSQEQLRKVARLQMKDVASRLAERGIALDVYGARPIRRWLEKKVVTEMSKMLVREEIDENSTVYIDAGPKGSGLVYKVEKEWRGILQSQGRILKKMRFMPSSLSSNSHRLLTALVDSRHKKVYKVKNCITDIDPEREKEEKEKAESQNIRANVLLNRKREKVNRKYTPTVDRRRQLSPGFLEDALDEDDETDYYDSRLSRRHFEEDLEVEARAEKHILNAKKGPKDIPRKSSLPTAKSSRRLVDFFDSEQEESEYESDGEEGENC
nr:protein leo1 like [Quercus suber]